jgi:hypothetical protein
MNTNATTFIVAASVAGISGGGMSAEAPSVRNFGLAADGEVQITEADTSTGGREHGTSAMPAISRNTISKWTSSLEREFGNLVGKFALQEPMTEEEQARLNLLRDKRRMLKNPPSIEERLYENRRTEVIKETLQALRKHVQFFKIQNTK